MSESKNSQTINKAKTDMQDIGTKGLQEIKKDQSDVKQGESVKQNESREAFEKVFKQTGFYEMNPKNAFCIVGDKYMWEEVQAAWDIWQAQQAKIDERQKQIDAAISHLNGFRASSEISLFIELALKALRNLHD